jgi:hypothetical protein
MITEGTRMKIENNKARIENIIMDMKTNRSRKMQVHGSLLSFRISKRQMENIIIETPRKRVVK